MKKKPMSRKEYTTFMKLIARRAKAEENEARLHRHYRYVRIENDGGEYEGEEDFEVREIKLKDTGEEVEDETFTRLEAMIAKERGD